MADIFNSITNTRRYETLMNEADGRVLRLRSKHSHRDSGFCDHWALKRGLIVGTRLCDSIDRRSFSPPPSLSLPLFHRTSFLFSSSLLSLSLSPSTPSISPSNPPVTCLYTLENTSQLLGRSSQMCQSIFLSTQSPRLTGPQQTGLFINGQRRLFTACSFMIRLNWMDLKCLTD